jgi:hypothetical protein
MDASIFSLNPCFVCNEETSFDDLVREKDSCSIYGRRRNKFSHISVTHFIIVLWVKFDKIKSTLP